MTRGTSKLQPCALLAFIAAALFVASCGPVEDGEEGVENVQSAATSAVIKFVFVVAMENHDASQIYGNTTDAPYINNTLMAKYARATNFNDELPSLASEPHYLWMEAGTNAFSDHTFTTDNDPSASN